MSEIKCNRCGRMTNTALCEFDFRHPELGAEFCYAAWDDIKWVHGCAPITNLSKLDKYERYLFDYARSIIGRGENKNEDIN